MSAVALSRVMDGTATSVGLLHNLSGVKNSVTDKRQERAAKDNAELQQQREVGAVRHKKCCEASLLQVRNTIQRIRLTVIDILNFVLDVRRDYRIELALTAFRELHDSYDSYEISCDSDDDQTDHSAVWSATRAAHVSFDCSQCCAEK